MLLYCKKCGSELKGVKNFCIICGTKQDHIKKEDRGTVVDTKKRPKEDVKNGKDEEIGRCLRCGESTEKKCFFCDDFVCRDHYTKMQANIHPYEELINLKANGENRKINEGWRGFIIFSCPRCTGRKNTKGLTQGESDAINIFNQCSWYKLDR